MSAFVGHLTLPGSTAPFDLPAAQVAVKRLAYRSPGQVRETKREVVWGALQSDAEGDFFADNERMVMLDGRVDNLVNLIPGAVGTAPPILRPAQRLGELFRLRGFDLLGELQGNFAIVFVDLVRGAVTLVRDRFGTRPLVYARVPGGWCWASEMRALSPFLPTREIDLEALPEVVYFGNLVGDRRLLRGVRQVLATSAVTLGVGTDPVEQRYWSLRFLPDRGPPRVEEWCDRVDTALDRYFSTLSQRHERIAVLLSGGVDSSLLAAKAAQHFRHVIAVTPKWTVGENPELEMAANVARHLGLTHLTPELNLDEMSVRFQEIVWRLEMPPRHFSTLPLYKALDSIPDDIDGVIYGEAADTLFGNVAQVSMVKFLRRQRMFAFMPMMLKQFLGRLLLAGSNTSAPWFAARLRMLGEPLIASHFDKAHRTYACAGWERSRGVFRGVPDMPEPNSKVVRYFRTNLDDALRYLREHTLYTDVLDHVEMIDRLAAGRTFQILIPFLSNEVVEVATQLPPSLLFEGNVAKPVLKQLASRYLPREWMYIEKKGFDTPTSQWLSSGAINRWLALLDERRTQDRRIIRMDELRRLSLEDANMTYWTAAALELWMRQFVDEDDSVIPNAPAPAAI